jgi:hypothetical protein
LVLGLSRVHAVTKAMTIAVTSPNLMDALSDDSEKAKNPCVLRA